MEEEILPRLGSTLPERSRKNFIALLLAASMLVASASLGIGSDKTAAATGGLSIGGGTASPAPASATGGVRFGSRILREGMIGEDVRVLNALVRAQNARRVTVSHRFHARTSGAVRRFQARNSLRPTGVVDRRTAISLTGTMRRAKSTWYGPGFYGNKTACGQRLTYSTVGVAHRRLPCGTKVAFRHRGRTLVAEVIDRGPFVRGIMWDLTGAAARGLGFSGSGPIRYAIAH